MSVEAPAFDVLTSDVSQVDKVAEVSGSSWWSCRVPGCVAVCSEPSELADHYSAIHLSSIDLTIPPTVIVPSGTEPDSDSDSRASVSGVAEDQREDSAGVNSWPGIPCPFAGCGLCIASYPGLAMHHKRVHGVPLPAEQRRAIATVYRARHLDANRTASDLTAAAGSSEQPSTSSAAVSDSFVCPFTDCGVSCSSRNDLVAHIHLSHPEIIQPVCKEEMDDDSTSATK